MTLKLRGSKTSQLQYDVMMDYLDNPDNHYLLIYRETGVDRPKSTITKEAGYDRLNIVVNSS